MLSIKLLDAEKQHVHTEPEFITVSDVYPCPIWTP